MSDIIRPDYPAQVILRNTCASYIIKRMSEKYKIADDELPHFITCTVIGWVNAFCREAYKEKVMESIRFCQANKGLKLHAWVIMSNHLHLIVSSEENKLSDIVRDFKKYTSKQIIEAIKENDRESRREWMLNMFRYAGKGNNDNKEYQFWRNGYHPVELNTRIKVAQRLNYLHENPVRAGIVWEPQDYKYSSAIDYYTTIAGKLDVERL